MTSAIFEIIIVVVLIVLNGVFAMSELAVLSARRPRLQKMADDGNTRARAALSLKDDPDRFLSTIQIGITLVGVFAGTFAGANIAKSFAPMIDSIPAFKGSGDTIALTLVVAFVTFLSLIVGELVPKQIALAHKETIASWVAKPMAVVSKISSPIVWVLSRSSALLLRLMRLSNEASESVTEEEVQALLREGSASGLFEQMEHEILERAIQIGDRQVSSIMTQRVDVVWIDVEDPYDEIVKQMIQSGHSTFPVGEGEVHNVLGVVSVKDLWAAGLKGETDDIKSAMKPALFVPPTMTSLRLLEMFKVSRSTFAIVTDEHGNVDGIVSLADILEALVGDLPSEEIEEEDVVVRADGSLLVDGLMPIEDFKRVISTNKLPDDDRGYFQTLAGFVQAQLGAVPKTGDRFECAGFSYEVVDMDGRRVDRVLVTNLNIPDSEE